MSKGRAARVVPFTVRGSCDCAACAEQEQLHQAATFHPDARVRLCAAIFLNALNDVGMGRTGVTSIEQLFD